MHVCQLSVQAGTHAALLPGEYRGAFDNNRLDVVDIQHLAGFLEIGEFSVFPLRLQQIGTGFFQLGSTGTAALLFRVFALKFYVAQRALERVIFVVHRCRQDLLGRQLRDAPPRNSQDFSDHGGVGQYLWNLRCLAVCHIFDSARFGKEARLFRGLNIQKPRDFLSLIRFNP
ncbi:MAG: hypothetical protein WBN43_18570 [Thiogranum sp.]